jgi:methylglutaconyl-CoA hydratase
MPTLTALDGIALGGGLELALATDLRIANAHVKLGLPETQLAIIPGAGGTQRLMRLIGMSKAKEMIFLGKIVNGKQAQEMGLVNDAVDGVALDRAMEWAEELLLKGPLALKMAKKAMEQGIECSMRLALDIEKQCYDQVIPTQDRVEGNLFHSES